MSLNNDNPNIIVEIIAGTQNFLRGVTDAIQKATKQFNDFTAKIFNDSKKWDKLFNIEIIKKEIAEIERLSKAINVATKQQREYAASVDAHKTALNDNTISGLRFRAAQALITAEVQKTGATFRESALALVQSGELEINTAQKVLAVNNQKLLSNQQLLGAISSLQQKQNALVSSTAGYNNVSNVATKNTQQLASATTQLGQATNTTTTFMTRFLERLALYFSIRQVIQFFIDAGKAALEFAQSQFRLETFVKAAQRTLGSQAGTMQQWKDRVKELRREFAIFSEKEITDAVAQTANLTRAIGLNAEQQKQLIEIAATLAQTAGVSLTDAIDDVVKALGGSSVVLDKYGLFVRDADKSAVSLSMGLGGNAKALNSQQLALVSLNTILRQTKDLTAGLSGYEETLPGQIARADARIADQTKKLGEGMSDVGLFIKNIWGDILELLNSVASSPIIQQALESVKILNELYKVREKVKSQGFDPEAERKKLGLSVKPAEPFAKKPNITSGHFGGVSFYTTDQLKGDKKNLELYQEYLDKTIQRISETMSKTQMETANIMDKIGHPRKLPGEDESDRLSKIAELSQKFGKDIVDAWQNYTDDLAKLEDKRTEDIKKANDDYLQALEDNKLAISRKLEDLRIDVGQKEQDILRDYQRNLQSITDDTTSKQVDLEVAHNNRIIELRDDFYRKLRDLDNQYYFDLRDAVAERDAVAIKHLERKYNLDKQKLENNLNDQISDENDAFALRQAKLKEETDTRKAEFTRRYNQELEDLRIYNERKLAEIELDKQRELADLKAKHDLRLKEINNNYILEGKLINDAYAKRLADLVRNIDNELKLTDQELRQIFGKYAAFYGPGGSLDVLMQQYYARQGQLQSGLANSVGNYAPNFQTSPTYPESGSRFYQQYTDSSGNIHYVVIRSDGTTSDYIIGKVIDQLSATIAGAVFKSGGTAHPI